MRDLFHAKVPKPFIQKVFDVMSARPQHTYQNLTKRPTRLRRMAGDLPWPENVWIGTSVEEPKVLDRVADLAQVPAAIRFVSCEPLIAALPDLPLDRIDWVIAGGGSGPRHREMQAEWVRDIRDPCLIADVPFLFKQWGGGTPKQNGRELDGRLWDGYPLTHRRGERGEAQP
jgi:protein gp37